jgi:predicted MFS family arabinose efflux permease
MTRRRALRLGLFGVALGTLITASAPHLAVFTLGIIVLAASKVAFDVALGAWVADHVPWNRRSKVVGYTETSWALGLLLGVTTMGLITAVTNWRVAYATGAIAVLILGLIVSNRLPVADDVIHEHNDDLEMHLEHGVLRRGSWYAIASCFTLMGASQCIFVTFGPWLEDTFEYSAANIAIVGFSLGVVEFLASTSSAKYTDAFGKEKSVAIGALLMVPASLLIALASQNIVSGLIGLLIVLMGFEFAVVSLLPLGAQLVPGKRGRGMGLLIGSGTLGRAAVSIAATRLYDQHGIPPAAIGSGLLALGTVLLISMHAKVAEKI